MELAAAAKMSKPKPTLPLEYSSFASVFSKEATDHIPPSRPYNHEINLDDAFTPNIGKVYPLSPNERKATEDFLNENLASGKIRPSNSPQASPFFFIKRRMEDSVPAKTTATSMNIPSATLTPFPSSLISSTNYEMPKSSPNSTFVGDTTTCESKMAINERQPLSPIKGYLNPQSCSLVSPTLPPPFKGS